MTTQQVQANGTKPQGKAKATGGKGRDPEGRMPLTEHIRELRTRLVRCTIAILLGAVVGYLIHTQVLDALSKPICEAKVRGITSNPDCASGALTMTGITSSIGLTFKVSLMVGLVLASPVWLYQLWAFIAPGLHKNEKRYGLGFVAAGVPLFLAGAGLCYLIFGQVVTVLLSFLPKNANANVPLDQYVNFFLRMILVFGASFEVPLLVVLLNFVGILSANRLKATWRYVTFAIFVFAAAAVPTGEPLGMLALAVPMCALFYGAIGIAVLNDRRRAARDLNANLSPDEASSLDLAPLPIEPAAPIEQVRRDYDDLT